MEVDKAKNCIAENPILALDNSPPPPSQKETLLKWTNLFSNTSRHLLLVFDTTFFPPVDSLPSDMFLLYFRKTKRITIDANYMADFSSNVKALCVAAPCWGFEIDL
jgi:hypothetical protein